METTVPTENDIRIAQARKTYTGKRLSESQFDQSWAIAQIMEREIRKTGQFVAKLGDYAYAFSREERFDVATGESILRDQFKARYGRTMNDLRKGLMDREENLPQTATEQALDHAREIGRLIQEGETMPFFRAYDRQAMALAQTLNVTESGAKKLMKDAFEEQDGLELYGLGEGHRGQASHACCRS